MALISIIVPLYNEEEVLTSFHAALAPVIDSLEDDVEIIHVDDGSTDASVDVLNRLAKVDNRLKLVKLSRNFGKEVAMTAGLDAMKGDCAIFIDADLQDPPELIADFVRLWKQGFDNVYGLRTSRRQDTFMKRKSAELFYRFFNVLSRDQLVPNAGDYRLLGAKAVQALKLCREKQRFMKGLYSWVGFSSVAVPYERPARAAGKTTFNSARLLSFALDGIIAHSNALLRACSYLGFTAIFCSFLLVCWMVFDFIVSGNNPDGFYITILVILSLSSIQLIMLGVLGEYVWRIFDEVKDRPLYIVDKTQGFDRDIDD